MGSGRHDRDVRSTTYTLSPSRRSCRGSSAGVLSTTTGRSCSPIQVAPPAVGACIRSESGTEGRTDTTVVGNRDLHAPSTRFQFHSLVAQRLTSRTPLSPSRVFSLITMVLTGSKWGRKDRDSRLRLRGVRILSVLGPPPRDQVWNGELEGAFRCRSLGV